MGNCCIASARGNARRGRAHRDPGSGAAKDTSANRPCPGTVTRAAPSAAVTVAPPPARAAAPVGDQCAVRSSPLRGRAQSGRARRVERCGERALRAARAGAVAEARGGGCGGPGEEEGVGDVGRQQALGKQNRGGQVVVVLEGDEVAHLPALIGLGGTGSI
jgi:hypothetical protein